MTHQWPGDEEAKRTNEGLRQFLEDPQYIGNEMFIQARNEWLAINSEISKLMSHQGEMLNRINHIKFMLDHNAEDNIQPLIPGYNTFKEIV